MRFLKKAIKIIKKISIFLLLFVIGGAFYSLGVTTYETIRVNKTIKNFINRAEYEEDKDWLRYESDEYDVIRKYFKVSRETYERDNYNVFVDENKRELGQKGDIFVGRTSAFPEKPVIHEFITYYFGGHASISDGDGGFYETIGIANDNIFDVIKHDDQDDNHNFSVTVEYTKVNDWQKMGKFPEDRYFGYYRNEFIGLRVKEMNEDLLDGVINYLDDKVERRSLYNFLFFLDMTNKYYCTDLVSRAYSYVLNDNKEVLYANRLNDDGFITSVNDLILSKDTYIAFYFKLTSKKIDNKLIIYENYYYLEDIN